MALVSGLNADYAGSMVFTEENPRNWAHSGYDLAEAAAAIDGWVASHVVDSEDQTVFFISYGIIIAVGETEANFKSNYLYIIDALRAKWPNSTIFLTYPWSANSPTRGTTIKPWIDDVIAARSNIYAGDDEGIWAENGDNGATMYYDGLHYSAAGHAAKVVALRARTLAVLGY